MNKSLNQIKKELYLLCKKYKDEGDEEIGNFLFEVYLYLCNYRNLLLHLEEQIDKERPDD